MASAVVGSRSKGRLTGGRSGFLLLLPAALLLGVFFLVPLGLMVETSFREGPSAYARIFQSPQYTQVFGNTIRIAFLTTIFCLLLAYPYAYVLTRANRSLKLLMLAVVLLPFWVSLLVRSFAWVGLLQDSGLVNAFLQTLGLGPVGMIRTELGILIGMVHILLPYMVLPLVTTMGQIDQAILRAAQSFGAGPWNRFQRVFLPLSLPGIISGCVLVFVLSLGFYITPALLGSPANMMIGEMIVLEIQRYGPVTASALGLVLLGGTLVSVAMLLGVRSLTTGRKAGLS